MSELTRPTWAEGWGEIPNQSPAAHAKPARDRKVYVIVAMGLALVATLALSIIAAFDSERAFGDVYARWMLAEARIDGLVAERDLANEAWSQCSGRPLGPGA